MILQRLLLQYCQKNHLNSQELNEGMEKDYSITRFQTVWSTARTLSYGTSSRNSKLESLEADDVEVEEETSFSLHCQHHCTFVRF